MLTNVCGVVTPHKATPVANRSKQKGNFRCPRCNGRFTRPRSVKDHFIKCVSKYGNPSGLSWWDHATLEQSRDWYHQHLPTAKDEEGADAEEGMKEEGNEMEEDLEEPAQVGESGLTAGEQTQQGGVRIGEESGGPGLSDSA